MWMLKHLYRMEPMGIAVFVCVYISLQDIIPWKCDFQFKEQHIFNFCHCLGHCRYACIMQRFSQQMSGNHTSAIYFIGNFIFIFKQEDCNECLLFSIINMCIKVTSAFADDYWSTLLKILQYLCLYCVLQKFCFPCRQLVLVFAGYTFSWFHRTNINVLLTRTTVFYVSTPCQCFLDSVSPILQKWHRALSQVVS